MPEPRDFTILACANQPHTRSELAKNAHLHNLNVSERTFLRDCNRLINDGMLQAVGERNAKYGKPRKVTKYVASLKGIKQLQEDLEGLTTILLESKNVAVKRKLAEFVVRVLEERKESLSELLHLAAAS